MDISSIQNLTIRSKEEPADSDLPILVYLCKPLPKFLDKTLSKTIHDISASAKRMKLQFHATKAIPSSEEGPWYDRGKKLLLNMDKSKAYHDEIRGLDMPAKPIGDCINKGFSRVPHAALITEHRTEADVVMCGYLHILDPICRPLWLTLNMHFKVLSELTKSELSASGAEDEEDFPSTAPPGATAVNTAVIPTIAETPPEVPDKPQVNTGRSDLLFLKNGMKSAFAILEYKRRGAILRALEGTGRKKRDRNRLFEPPQNKTKPSSAFTGDWVKLIKQATLYANLHHTKYVALYDWDILVLIKFDKLKSGRNVENEFSSDAGTDCEISFIRESGRIRLALLEFIRTAYYEPRVEVEEDFGDKPDKSREDDMTDLEPVLAVEASGA